MNKLLFWWVHSNYYSLFRGFYLRQLTKFKAAAEILEGCLHDLSAGEADLAGF